MILLGVMCLGSVLRAQAADIDTISGLVYLDANGNGKCDSGERGLAGIRVTDGIGFATTDVDGAYSLKIADDYMIPFRPARTVSVCWPTGKWPAGRWWHRLSEITDTKAVSFGLRDDEQKVPFVFLHTSDDHGSGVMYRDHYSHDARLMKPAAKFLFNTGDMGYATPDCADQMFGSIAGHAAAFPIPMILSPGNHDFVGETTNKPMNSHPLAGWGAYTKYLGPVRWSFDYAGVHFIGIDYMEKTDKGYEDRIPHVAVQFLEKDLSQIAKGTRVVLLVHCFDASADFFNALHKFKIEYICCGHTHTPFYCRVGRVPTHTNFGVAAGVVTADAIDVVERRSISLGGTQLGYFEKVTVAAMERRRQKQHAVVDKKLKNSTFAIAGSPLAESVEIVADIIPGDSGRVGLRIGKKGAIEITFDGKAVSIAGAPVPFSLIPEDIIIPAAPGAPTNAPIRKIAADRSVRWHILIDRDRVTVAGNSLFRLSKAVKVDQPASVTLLADGGEATFKKLDVWELRTISNPASRGLHHFPPPAWSWGVSQHTAACLDDKSKEAVDILKRYSADGVMDYDM